MSNGDAKWLKHLEEILKSEPEIEERDQEQINTAEFSPPRKTTRVALPKVDIRFDNEFAPSTYTVGLSDASLVEGGAKNLFYGDDWHYIGEAAIERCTDFGLPKLCWPTLGTYTPISDELSAELMGGWAELIAGFDEGSDDWTCLLIYQTLLSLSNLDTIGSPDHLKFQEAFKIGGLVQELHLSNRNKSNAILGRKTRSNVQRGGQANIPQYKTKRDQVISRMAEFMSQGHTKANAARLAAERGIGSSKAANIKLYNRHARK